MQERILEIGARPAIDTIKKELGIGIVGAEIGVNKGYNACYICNIIKPKTLYLIDPWNNFFDPSSGEIIGEAQYLTTKELLQPFICCNLIRKTSFEAISDFANESLDFVYIDADHSFNAVLSDAIRWYPKVKKNGILSGHDFTTSSVANAVKVFCKKAKIKELYAQNEDFWFFRKE